MNSKHLTKFISHSWLKHKKLQLQAQPDKENLRKEAIDDMILKGEMLSALSLRSRRRQGYPLSPFLFIIILEIVEEAREINKREK